MNRPGFLGDPVVGQRFLDLSPRLHVPFLQRLAILRGAPLTGRSDTRVVAIDRRNTASRGHAVSRTDAPFDSACETESDKASVRLSARS